MTKTTHHQPDTDLTHSMVHYLLTIHKLKEEKGYARVTDIAKDMELTKGSVSTALNSLKKKELIVEDENKFFTLSTDGHHVVHEILSSRSLLFYFLKDVIGVNEETAHQDSCLMEHLLSGETREKFFKFMKKITSGTDKKIKTDLDLSKFNTASEFTEVQKGEGYHLEK
jgi:DtxR family Mn-dependent transcriptional regulator